MLYVFSGQVAVKVLRCSVIKMYLGAEEASLSVFQRQLYTSSVMIASMGINIHCICFYFVGAKIPAS